MRKFVVIFCICVCLAGCAQLKQALTDNPQAVAAGNSLVVTAGKLLTDLAAAEIAGLITARSSGEIAVYANPVERPTKLVMADGKSVGIFRVRNGVIFDVKHMEPPK